MSGQEGSKPDLTSLLAVLIGKLYAVLEQFDSKVVSGQQNPQAVRVGSLLIAKAFTYYGMLKLASMLMSGCAKTLREGMETFESNLKTISNILAQDQPDIAINVGDALEALSTNESLLTNSLLVCITTGKQA